MEVGFVFLNSFVLHAAGESEISEVSCVMHKRLQMIRNKTITWARGGVETSGDKIWCDLRKELKGSNCGPPSQAWRRNATTETPGLSGPARPSRLFEAEEIKVFSLGG